MACRKFIDIGANLTDPVFRGLYRGKQKHVDDMKDILKRSYEIGMSHIVVTGGSLKESKSAVELCSTEISDVKLSATVGCHPTRSSEMVTNGKVDDGYIQKLCHLIETNGKHVAAIGEFGLDYDRLHFADKETQLIAFEAQLDKVVGKFGKGCGEINPLPLFLHCRASGDDFILLITKYRNNFNNGVVHSFTGTWEECSSLLDLGMHIGINGCSLKTEENLEVAKKIPLDRILIETDCPYCEVRPSHASHKLLQQKSKRPQCQAEKWKEGCLIKGRNEPSTITDVFEVLCALRCDKDGVNPDELADIIYRNTRSVFPNLID